MNLILTSNLPSIPIEAVYQRMRQTGKQPRIAWIPPYKDIDNRRFATAKTLFETQGFVRLEPFSMGGGGAESSNRIKNFDIIYLSGGDPIQFRANLLQSNLASHLRSCMDDGKMIVASSGGSMQLGQNISVFRLINLEVEQVIAQRKRYEALGIVPYEFLPHLNVHDQSFLEKVQRYSQAIGHPVIGVEDGGALIHSSRDMYKLAGHASIFHHGEIESIRGEA
jgi:dipeptidase E